MTITDNEHADLPTPNVPCGRTCSARRGAGRRAAQVPRARAVLGDLPGDRPIRRTAAVLAGHGFVVAVRRSSTSWSVRPRRRPAVRPGRRRPRQRPQTAKELAGYDADARACLDYLRSHPACTGRLGVMGICIGGHLAFRAAMNADVEAAACFYATDIHKRSLAKGMHDDTLDRMREIKGEMLMVWGRQDPHVPREGRRLIYDAMTDAGSGHLARVQRPARLPAGRGQPLRPELARLCYGMVVDLFRRVLGTGT